MSVFKNLYTDSFAEYDEQLKQKNDLSEFVFFNLYSTAIINSFRWKKGLPKNLPVFAPEEFLLRAGTIAYFYKDGEKKLFPAYPSGTLLENGLFSQYTAIAPNGTTYILPYEDVELCFNNSFKLPYLSHVKYFSEKTSYSVMALDSALEKASVPTIVSCADEGQLKTIESIIDKLKNLKPVRAFIKSKFDKNDISRVSAFDNRENDVLALWDVYARYRNLFYTTFGINNVEITKKERLTEAEGKGNDEIVRYSLFDDMLHMRLDFIERVKNHFGDEIEIEVRRDSSTVYDLTVSQEEKIKEQEILISKGANIQSQEVQNDSSLE